jgi:plastocyanin
MTCAPSAHVTHSAMSGLVAAMLMVSTAMVSADGQDELTVTIQKFAFHPPEITVKKGSTVRWVNAEKRQYHSVWFEETGEPEPDYFFPEEFYDRVFDAVGTFPYRCGPHPRMRGVVRVVE